MPAACSACRCCEVLAIDCPVARASWSTVRGAWASRSRISSRSGLANALPISAIASNSAFFSGLPVTVGHSSNHLIACQAMFFRQLFNDESACASYMLGCKTVGEFAVIDPHVDLVDDYVALADAQGARIAAVFETHVQADHVSGLPELVARAGATAYLPEGAGVEFEHHGLSHDE